MKSGSDLLVQRTKFFRMAWQIVRPVLIGFVLAIFVIPIGAMILTSFKSQGDALSWPPKILFKPTLENYRNIFALYPFADYLRNSVKVTLGATALSLLFGLPAAYALARFPIRRKEDVAMWFLSLRILPPIAVVIPFFIMLRNASLLDDPFGLMVIYLTFDIPFVVWVSRGFFREVPSELQDAALVDGCSEFGAFFRIALPLAKGGVAATAILHSSVQLERIYVCPGIDLNRTCDDHAGCRYALCSRDWNRLGKYWRSCRIDVLADVRPYLRGATPPRERLILGGG